MEINDAYIQKHWELVEVFSAFRTLHSRFDKIRTAVDANLGDMLSIISKADQQMISPEKMKELQQSQIEIATQTAQLDDHMGTLVRQYSESLGEGADPLFFDTLRTALMSATAYTVTTTMFAGDDSSIGELAEKCSKNLCEVFRYHTADSVSLVDMGIGIDAKELEAGQRNCQKITEGTGADVLGGKSFHALMSIPVQLSDKETVEPYNSMLSAYITTQRHISYLLNGEPRAYFLRYFKSCVPHVMALHSYDLHPTLVARGQFQLMTLRATTEAGATKTRVTGVSTLSSVTPRIFERADHHLCLVSQELGSDLQLQLQADCAQFSKEIAAKWSAGGETALVPPLDYQIIEVQEGRRRGKGSVIVVLKLAISYEWYGHAQPQYLYPKVHLPASLAALIDCVAACARAREYGFQFGLHSFDDEDAGYLSRFDPRTFGIWAYNENFAPTFYAIDDSPSPFFQPYSNRLRCLHQRPDGNMDGVDPAALLATLRGLYAACTISVRGVLMILYKRRSAAASVDLDETTSTFDAIDELLSQLPNWNDSRGT